jgi:soluble lytic murein transglycosylase-like protein
MDIIIYAVIIFVVAYLFFGGRLGVGNLNYNELLNLAVNAGFTDTEAKIAAAIALAESRGNPKAYNPETAARGGTPEGKGSYGLWQIYLHKHPEFEGQDLTDPQTNANAAYSVYKGSGYNFHPWSTFQNQNYLSFLS